MAGGEGDDDDDDDDNDNGDNSHARTSQNFTNLQILTRCLPLPRARINTVHILQRTGARESALGVKVSLTGDFS